MFVSNCKEDTADIVGGSVAAEATHVRPKMIFDEQ